MRKNRQTAIAWLLSCAMSFCFMTSPLTALADAAPAANGTAGESKITASIKNGDGSGAVEDLRQMMDAGAALRWDVNKQKMLTVQVYSTLNLTGKRVKITVPAGIKLVQYPVKNADEPFIETLTVTRPAGNWGGYSVQGGTLDYTLKPTTQTITFNIMLEVDRVIWNKVDGQRIADAIAIETYADSDDQTVNEKKDEVRVDAEALGSLEQSLWNNDVNSSVPAEADLPFKVRQWIISNAASEGMQIASFFKKLTLVVPVPYDPDKGDYAQYDSYTVTDGTPAPDVSVDETAHAVTFTWENCYQPLNGIAITPKFKWTTARNVGGKATVEDPTAKLVYADGSEFDKTPSGGSIRELNIVSGEQVTVSGSPKAQYNWYADDPGIVYQLGQFQIRNDGFVLSPKHLTFTYSSDVGIVAQRIPVDRGETVTNIQFRTNKDSTLRTYGDGTLSSARLATDGSGAVYKEWSVLVTAEDAGLIEGEYFTYLSADVPPYSTGYVGYNPSAGAAPNNACVTFGKLLEGGVHTYQNVATLSMEDIGGGNEKSASFYVRTTEDDSFTVQMQVNSANVSPEGVKRPIMADKAAAGETVNVNGSVELTSYPYTHSQMTMNPVIYVRLPKDIGLENLQLYQVKTSELNRAGSVETLLQPGADYVSTQREEAGTGYVVYKLAFVDNKGGIGWFNDNLGQTSIRISFDMDISLEAKAQSLDLRDCIFIADEKHSVSGSGSLSTYQVADRFDVDDDGDTTEQMSTTASTKLSISPARRGLLFKSAVKLSDESEYYDYDSANAGKKIAYLTGDQTLDFRFTAKNNTGRDMDEEETTSFYYYIPVPKTGDRWDPHFQDEPFAFSVDLTGPAMISGLGGDVFSVAYSTTVRADTTESDPLHYNQDIENNYVDAAAIEAAGAWDQVKMIRVSAKPGSTSIVKDASVSIDWSYKLWANGATALVGSEIEFGPCGFTKFTVDGLPNTTGHVPTQRVRFALQTGLITGHVFLDKSFTGVRTEDAASRAVPDDYTKSIRVTATDTGDPSNTKTVTTDTGVYALGGLRAGTYEVKIENPGSTDANDPSKTPLRFSLPAGGAFSVSADGTSAKATVTVDMDHAAANAALHVGLQEPHTVTFSAANATLNGTSTRVWHGDTVAGLPSVTAATGYRFMNQWKQGDLLYSAEQLALLEIDDDVTFTARVLQIRTLATTGDYTGLSYAHQSFTPAVTSTPNAGPDLTYASSNEDVATVDTASGLVQIVGVGDAVITVSAVEDDQVTACELEIPVHVEKGLITVTAGTLQAQKTYDGSKALSSGDFSGALAASGFASGDGAMLDQSSLSGEFTADANAATGKEYTVTGYRLTAEGEKRYRLADNNRTLTLSNGTVLQKQLTIAPKSPVVSKEFGKPLPQTEWVVTGLAPGEKLYTADAMITGDLITDVPTGAAGILAVTHEAGVYSPIRQQGYAVTPALTGSVNYTAQLTPGTLMVVKNVTPLSTDVFALADTTTVFNGTAQPSVALSIDRTKIPGGSQLSDALLQDGIQVSYTYTRQKLPGESYPESLYQPSQTPPVQAGVYTVEAQVQSGYFTLETSAYTAVLTIEKATPTLVVLPCLGSAGAEGTVAVYLSGPTGSEIAPEGSVAFYQTGALADARPQDAELLGERTLTGLNALAQTALRLTEPENGGHTVFAVYAGDINYNAVEAGIYHEPEATPPVSDVPAPDVSAPGGPDDGGGSESREPVQTGGPATAWFFWLLAAAGLSTAVVGLYASKRRTR